MEARSFGADDRPVCPKCGKQMHLIRRGPHPEQGEKYEVQLFLCASCNHEESRSTDKAGDAYA
jgi:transposase-like protein